MSEHEEPASPEAGNEDAAYDVISAIALVLIPVVTLVVWLSGMPT